MVALLTLQVPVLEVKIISHGDDDHGLMLLQCATLDELLHQISSTCSLHLGEVDLTCKIKVDAVPATSKADQFNLYVIAEYCYDSR